MFNLKKVIKSRATLIITIITVVASVDTLLLGGRLGALFGGSKEVPLGSIILIIVISFVVHFIMLSRPNRIKEILSIDNSDKVTEYMRNLSVFPGDDHNKNNLPTHIHTYVPEQFRPQLTSF